MRICWFKREKSYTTREMITQRSESSQSQLLDQIFSFFNYFWSIEFVWFRATIMLFKVYEIVDVQKLIQARKDDDSWVIEWSKSSISFIVVATSNLHIFQWFSKHWSHLSRLYNCHHRKYWAQAHLVENQADDELIERQMMNQRVKIIIIKMIESIICSNDDQE